MKTDRKSGEPDGQWLTRHTRGIQQAGVGGQDTLTTTYQGPTGACTVTTNRTPGASDTLFIASHRSKVASEFDTCPPED